MFSGARYQSCETNVTVTSNDSPPSSSPSAQWFLKYRKYILSSLVAGLSLAVILALGLTLTTTTTSTTKTTSIVTTAGSKSTSAGRIKETILA